MRTITLYVSLLVASIWAMPAQAQFFGRKVKGTAAERVPELIVTAKSDQDERKRAAAAAELREYDANHFPEIVSVLADVAKSDPRPAVRQEALEGLTRIRPVSQLAGQTLQWAAAHDDSWKLRLQAKSSLMRYNWSGYAGKKDVPVVPGVAQPPGGGSTQEPPLIGSPSIGTPNVASQPVLTPPTVTFEAPPVKEPVKAQTTSGPLTRWFAPKNAAPPAASAKPVVTTSQPKPPVLAPAAAPVIVTEPLPSSPLPLDFETPPPVVIEVIQPSTPPPPLIAPVPLKKDASKTAKSVKMEPAVKTSAPLVTKSAAPTAPASKTVAGKELTEPNFRPVGQAPPRPAFTTAVPQAPAIVAPTKDADGPSLTPPM